MDGDSEGGKGREAMSWILTRFHSLGPSFPSARSLFISPVSRASPRDWDQRGGGEEWRGGGGDGGYREGRRGG